MKRSLALAFRVLAMALLSLRGAVPAATPARTVRTLNDVSFLAADRKEKLDLYLPAPPAPGQRFPAVVWIHGGGWAGGTKNEARAKNICGILADAGYVAVSIDYRLGDGSWPTNLYDCKNAVRFLRAHAGQYHVDPERIAVAGGSAGGHLALMVGLTADQPGFEPTGAATPYRGVSSQVDCIIDMYGITNLMTRQQTDAKGRPTATRRLMGNSLKYFGADSDTAGVLRDASPVTHVDRNSPPILILHGRADTTVDFGQAQELASVLEAKGVEHELVLLDGVGHTFTFETWNKKPLPRDVKTLALRFLERHLRP
jgi:acetyl esterase/lipase